MYVMTFTPAFLPTRLISRCLSGLALAGMLSACTAAIQPHVGNPAVPQPRRSVDLARYSGLWYEVGRYEAPFQKGCEAVTARYTAQADGSIEVLNSCRQDSVAGAVRSATGRATVVPESGNAKLKVSFFGPFTGDYWVLDHAPDYSWSIVGEGEGRFLWILSRKAPLSDAAYTALIDRAKALGYNTSLIRRTQH